MPVNNNNEYNKADSPNPVIQEPETLNISKTLGIDKLQRKLNKYFAEITRHNDLNRQIGKLKIGETNLWQHLVILQGLIHDKNKKSGKIKKPKKKTNKSTKQNGYMCHRTVGC